MLKRYFNIDGSASGGGSPSNSLSNFASFDLDAIDNIEFVAKPDAIKPPENLPADPAKPAETNPPVVQNNNQQQPPANQPPNDTQKPADNKQQPPQDNGKIFDFEIPGDAAPPENQDTPPQTFDVATLAKDFGIPEPDKIKSVTDIKGFYENQIGELRRKTEELEAFKSDPNKVLEEILPGEENEQVRQIVDFVRNGGTLDDFIDPAREVKQYLQLDDAELFKADLMARNLSEAEADEAVATFMEAGQLKAKALEIRLALKAEERQLLANQQEMINRSKAARDQQKTIEIQKKYDGVGDALKKIDNFMGGKIEDQHRTFLVNEFKSGRFRQILDDPNAIAQFLLYSAFGEQALKKMVDSSFENGRGKIAETISNIPPQTHGSGLGRTTQEQTPKEGDYSGWNNASVDLHS